MKPMLLGICALITPIFYDKVFRRYKIKRKTFFQNIKDKYALVDDNTDITSVSEKIPLILYKKLKYSEILDHEFGLKFSNSIFIQRRASMVSKDPSEISIQPTEYKFISDADLSNLTNKKFQKGFFEFYAKYIYLDKIEFKQNDFLKKNLNKVTTPENESISLISNNKDKNDNYVLANENDPNNSYLQNKFIDYKTKGNNIFIQSNKLKLLRNDLKINYLSYKPINFIVIGCREKETQINEAELNNNNNQRDVIFFAPAKNYSADDYIILPFEFSNQNNAKAEIDSLITNEIVKNDLSNLERRIRKFILVGGAVLFGYGYLIFELKNGFQKSINSFVTHILRAIFLALV